jgi:hypothetical protein
MSQANYICCVCLERFKHSPSLRARRHRMAVPSGYRDRRTRLRTSYDEACNRCYCLLRARGGDPTSLEYHPEGFEPISLPISESELPPARGRPPKPKSTRSRSSTTTKAAPLQLLVDAAMEMSDEPTSSSSNADPIDALDLFDVASRLLISRLSSPPPYRDPLAILADTSERSIPYANPKPFPYAS